MKYATDTETRVLPALARTVRLPGRVQVRADRQLFWLQLRKQRHIMTMYTDRGHVSLPSQPGRHTRSRRLGLGEPGSSAPAMATC